MVLSKGASERSAKVLRAYLQREPKMDAFLEEMGLRQWAVCLRSESVCGLLVGFEEPIVGRGVVKGWYLLLGKHELGTEIER